jgi:DedD protein
MKEMHKWKDKVELSLDNRQIFFLFFGLSIVGCFVFALGVMVGRRVDFDPQAQVASLATDGLELLDGSRRAQQQEFSFKQGLAEPATLGLPATREEGGNSDEPGDEPATAPSGESVAAKPAPVKTAADPKPAAKPAPAKSTKISDAETLAAASKAATVDRSGNKFTLQMKAFSRQEDADAFAERLNSNGHGARVEPHEVKGRMWYRVRVGAFQNWADGLAAKDEFEKAEKMIAYVVRLD